MIADNMEKVEIPYVGAKYHLSWANRACRWELKELIGDDKCLMFAPVSGKTLIAKIEDLRHLK